MFYVIPRSTKLSLNFFFGASCLGGIGERPVVFLHSRQQNRTMLVGMTTYRYYHVGVSYHLIGEASRFLPGNIDVGFGHDRYGAKILAMRLDTGGCRNHAVAAQMPRPPFGHLTTAGVAGTNKQQSYFSHSLLMVCGYGADASYQNRVLLTKFTTKSMTGTSTSTPTTVASAAPDSNP